jgi:triosephosphate isomerase (TIM)
MKRKLFIAGNWKLNNTAAETKATIADLVSKLSSFDGSFDVALFPSFLSISAAQEAAAGSVVKIGSQNVHFAATGAYTGEVSAAMLKEAGIEHVIIGHSERRQYFGETDETVNLRTKAALEAGLKPFTCIGETLEEREADYKAVLKRQLNEGLVGLTNEQMKEVVVAYEPVWAIGTGVTATAELAQETHAYVRAEIAAMFNQEVADAVIIQYGGSVKPANVVELMSCEDIDGALVGGASLKAEDFSALILNAATVG